MYYLVMTKHVVPQYTLFDPWVALRIRFREQVHAWWHGRNSWENDEDPLAPGLDIPPSGE